MLSIVLGTWDLLSEQKRQKRIPVFRNFTLVGSKEEEYIKNNT